MQTTDKYLSRFTLSPLQRPSLSQGRGRLVGKLELNLSKETNVDASLTLTPKGDYTKTPNQIYAI